MGVKFLCCKEVLSDFEKKRKKPKDNSQQDNSLKSEIRPTGYSPEPGLAPTSRHDPECKDKRWQKMDEWMDYSPPCRWRLKWHLLMHVSVVVLHAGKQFRQVECFWGQGHQRKRKRKENVSTRLVFCHPTEIVVRFVLKEQNLQHSTLVWIRQTLQVKATAILYV